MLTIIDTNNFLHQHYKKGFLKKENKVSSFFANPLNYSTAKSSFNHKLAKSINEQLATSLIYANGLLADIRENINEKEQTIETNFSELIKLVSGIIDVYINIQVKFEHFTNNGFGKEYPELKYVPETISQTITHLYNALRILKKVNSQQPIPTSELAKKAASHSLHSLQSVLNGH